MCLLLGRFLESPHEWRRRVTCINEYRTPVFSYISLITSVAVQHCFFSINVLMRSSFQEATFGGLPDLGLSLNPSNPSSSNRRFQ